MDRIANDMRAMLQTDKLISKPIQIEDKTIVVIFKMAFGFGSGGGKGTENKGEGGGGGASPVAVIVVHNGIKGPESVQFLKFPGAEGLSKTIMDVVDRLTCKEKADGNNITRMRRHSIS